MSSYSEKQLLMLSNFIYLPASTQGKTISQILDLYRDASGSFTAESVTTAGYGGGLNYNDVCTLFKEMDAEISNNPGFGSLSAVRTLNEGNVKALCYTDPNDSNPVVVFRGTGGSDEAWSDNFEGGFEEDTKMQKLAADFVRNECGAYKDITVAGHSKGGNLSQYVTIECSEQVNKCVSFDGQGFSKEYIDKNREKIENSAGKIKSISAYNDFVNILLTTVAGSVVYANNEDSLRAAHSSLSLLINNEFDHSGTLVSEKNQSLFAIALKKLTDTLVKKLDLSDPTDAKVFSNIVGKTIASALECSDSDDINRTLTELGKDVSLAMFAKATIKKSEYTRSVNPEYSYTKFDFTGVIRSVSELKSVKGMVDSKKGRVLDARDSLSYVLSSKLYADRRLNSICIRMDSINSKIDKLTEIIELVEARYLEKERTLTELFVL